MLYTNLYDHLLGDEIEALEAINFQPNRAFAKEVTDIFSKVQEEVDILMSTMRHPSTKYTERHDAVVKKIIPGLGKQLVEVTKKHTGLKFKVSIQKSAYADTPFCTTINFGLSTNDTVKVILNSTGRANIPYSKDTEAILKEINKAFDPATGTYKPKDKNDITQRMHATVYFDLHSSLLFKYWGPSNMEPLSPAELAAIYLHEIGHTMTMLERVMLFYHTDLAMAGYTENFEKASPKDKLKIIKREVEIYKKNGGEASTPILKAIFNLSDKAEDVDFLDVILEIPAAALLITWLTLYAFVMLLYLNVGYLTYQILFSIARGFESNTKKNFGLSITSSGKFSDNAYSRMSAESMEFWADQYATRMGVGGDLATGLKKLGPIMSHVSAHPFAHKSTYFSRSALYGIGVSFLYWMMNGITLRWKVVLDQQHGTDIERVQKIINDQAKIFRNMKLTDEQAKEALEQIEIGEQALRELKGGIFRAHVIREKFIRMDLHVLRAPGKALRILFAEKSMFEDANAFMQAIDSLSGNKIGASAARLRLLAKK